jgi:hypothetical protein
MKCSQSNGRLIVTELLHSLRVSLRDLLGFVEVVGAVLLGTRVTERAVGNYSTTGHGQAADSLHKRGADIVLRLEPLHPRKPIAGAPGEEQRAAPKHEEE